jgi:hypothetical protein
MQLRRDCGADALEVFIGPRGITMMPQQHLHRNLQGSAVLLHVSRDQQLMVLADEELAENVRYKARACHPASDGAAKVEWAGTFANIHDDVLQLMMTTASSKHAHSLLRAAPTAANCRGSVAAARAPVDNQPLMDSITGFTLTPPGAKEG